MRSSASRRFSARTRSFRRSKATALVDDLTMTTSAAGQPALGNRWLSAAARGRAALRRVRLLRLVVTFCRDAARVMVGDARRFLWSIKRPAAIRKYNDSHAVKKLHLGCGPVVLPGWLNTDLEPRRSEQLFIDVTEPLPFETGTIHYVFCEHLIGDLPYQDGCGLLRESYRVLRRGGRLRLSTPDLQQLASLYATKKTSVQQSYVEWVARVHSWWADAPLEGFAINALFLDVKFVYDRPTLLHALRAAGFTEIAFVRPGQSSDPELCHLERHGQVLGNESFNEFESLTIEAIK
jgi:predicted SAM-dependent methyltransferase